jgi:hypothetical protein
MTTTKRIAALGLAAAMLTAAAVTTTTGAAEEQQPAATIELTARDSESRFGGFDAPPRRSEGPGDSFTISARLRDSAGNAAGRADGAFSQTGRRRAHGSATFTLAGGRIVVAGVLDEAGSTDALTIVGGSGAYENARGVLTTGETRGGTSFRFELAP